MKSQHASSHRHAAVVAFAAVLSGTCAATALAMDIPKRKSGLWEIRTNIPNVPAQQGPMQVCVDEKTDDLTQQSAESEAKKNCSKSEMRHEGERFVVHSVCKFEGVTATSDGTFSGNFDSSYRGEMKTTYNPPMMGMSEAKVTMEAKWLGPCKPGQQPGDMILPNGTKISPSQMKGKR
jgi:hypothetical protein